MTLHPHFWEPVAPGFFLLWGIKQESEKHPKSSVMCFAQDNAPLCGYVPNDWDGTRVGFWTNPDKCGL